MTTGLINPVETAQNAIRAGILKDPACSENGILGHTNEEIERILRTPAEAGIARFRPTPKPTPCKLLKRAKREAGNRKYIITKKDRPDLFP